MFVMFLRVVANPETAPKIDWAAYKSKIGVAGLVDNFQKQYDAFKIPYPADKLTADVNAQEKNSVSQLLKSVYNIKPANDSDLHSYGLLCLGARSK